MKSSFLIAVASVAILLIGTAGRGNADVLYDSISSGGGVTRTLFSRPTLTTLDGTQGGEGGMFGGSFFGNAINLSGSTSEVVYVTQLDFYLAYAKSTPTNTFTPYAALDVRIQFWNEFGNTVATNNFFNDAAGGVQTFSLSPGSLGTAIDAGTFNIYTVTLDFTSAGHTPVFLKDRGGIGVAMNILGDGAITNNLTGYRTRGNGLVQGSSSIGPEANGGYLRNRAKSTDFNFLKVDGFPAQSELLGGAVGSNEGMGMRITGSVVPEAGSTALLLVGAVPLAGLALRRREK